MAVTPSAAKVKYNIMSGFKSDNVAGFPFTFTVVAGGPGNKTVAKIAPHGLPVIAPFGSR